jgi:hypothetical protein
MAQTGIPPLKIMERILVRDLLVRSGPVINRDGGREGFEIKKIEGFRALEPTDKLAFAEIGAVSFLWLVHNILALWV